MVYPALLTLMLTPRLSVVDWTDAPANLNGLVRFAERRNLVSASVPSHFKRSLIWASALRQLGGRGRGGEILRPFRTFATTMSQLKICDFSGEFLKCYNFLRVQRRQNCSPAGSFANCVMILYLAEVHLEKFLSILITQKCQILSCDTLVTNERYIYNFCFILKIMA